MITSDKADDDAEGDAVELEAVVGARIKALRARQRMTIKELAARTGLSQAMLSKLENGLAAPSLSTLKSLADVFSVSVAALFRDAEPRSDVSFVRAGEGVRISRQGPSASHEFRLLGHVVNPGVDMRPYLVELKRKTDVFPYNRDSGVWFVHVQDGEMDFRCGNEVYRLKRDDSLMYDADTHNGPEKLIRLPVRFLCIRADAVSGGARRGRAAG